MGRGRRGGEFVPRKSSKLSPLAPTPNSHRGTSFACAANAQPVSSSAAPRVQDRPLVARRRATLFMPTSGIQSACVWVLSSEPGRPHPSLRYQIMHILIVEDDEV